MKRTRTRLFPASSSRYGPPCFKSTHPPSTCAKEFTTLSTLPIAAAPTPVCDELRLKDCSLTSTQLPPVHGSKLRNRLFTKPSRSAEPRGAFSTKRSTKSTTAHSCLSNFSASDSSHTSLIACSDAGNTCASSVGTSARSIE